MKEMPNILRRNLSSSQLEKILQGYEAEYKMSSEEFYRKYNLGELGDDRDCVVWAGYFVMAVRSGIRDLVPA
jgi:hypothetical protein